MTEVIRGEKVIYERVESEDEVCRGCPYNPFGKSCLAWKYINPAICRETKKEITEMPIKVHQSPDKEMIGYHKILHDWDWKTGYKTYLYFRVKSIVDINGFRIVSVRKSNKGRYDDYQTKLRKKKPHTLTKYLPPHNPWK